MTAILHITRDFPPRAGGGVSTAVAGLVDALAASGIRSIVLSFDGYRPRDKSPVPESPRSSNRGNTEILRVTHPGQWDEANAWAAKQGADIYHCHSAILWSAVEALPARPAVLTPHVLQRHQNRVRKLRGTTLSAEAQDRAVTAATSVWAPSHFAETILRRDYPAAPIVTVPLAISDRPFRNVNRDCLTYLGRFSDVRGLDDWLVALPRCQPGPLRTVIAGGLPYSPRAERRWIRRIEDLQEQWGRPIETPGWLDEASAHSLLLRSRIVVVPSRVETFGMTCAEAMLAGAAVVATRAGALPEMVRDGVTGTLVPTDDPDSLAHAVQSLIGDPDRSWRMGMAAHREICARWLWPARVASLLAGYHALLRL